MREGASRGEGEEGSGHSTNGRLTLSPSRAVRLRRGATHGNTAYITLHPGISNRGSKDY